MSLHRISVVCHCIIALIVFIALFALRASTVAPAQLQSTLIILRAVCTHEVACVDRYVCVCVCVCACVRACVRACVCLCTYSVTYVRTCIYSASSLWCTVPFGNVMCPMYVYSVTSGIVVLAP